MRITCVDHLSPQQAHEDGTITSISFTFEMRQREAEQPSLRCPAVRTESESQPLHVLS